MSAGSIRLTPRHGIGCLPKANAAPDDAKVPDRRSGQHSPMTPDAHCQVSGLWPASRTEGRAEGKGEHHRAEGEDQQLDQADR